MTPVLEIAGVSAGYRRDVDVVSNIDLILGAGEIVTVIGPNGAGKSTLVKTILGLVAPRRGSIRLRGDDISGLAPHRIVRRGLGYVPQRANVFPSLSVAENLRLGCVGRREISVEDRLSEAITQFPTLHGLMHRRAGLLSGGERQMLAIARALMPDPDVVLLDEPSAALAPRAADAVFAKIEELRASRRTVLLVEQNASRALSIADRAYVLELGRNRLEGPASELLDDPEVRRLYLGA